MIEKNSVYEAEITDTNNLGYGICRIDNMVIFVQHGVCGDKAIIKIIKVAKNYCIARIEKLITPSNNRISPDCPMAKQCGGCTFRHISYEYEKELKRNFVKQAFLKQGLDIEIAPVCSDNKISGYRNKVQYPVDENGNIGYYKNKTHNIIPCENCFSEQEKLKKISSEISEYFKQNKIKNIRHLYLRYAVNTDEVAVCFVIDKPDYSFLTPLINELKNKKEIKCIAVNINTENTNVILGKETHYLYGEKYITDRLCSLEFRIGLHSFYQVNHDMAQLLYDKVTQLSKNSDSKKIIDLYCGCGTIGLSVAKSRKECELYGVEIVPEAIKYAKENAEINGVKNAEFICSDAKNASIGKSDLVIVDPPRKGLSDELIDILCEKGVRSVIYVSCNPETLARDCKIFTQKGYTISTAYPFDLFPRTSHVETVVLLSKLKSTHHIEDALRHFQMIE